MSRMERTKDYRIKNYNNRTIIFSCRSRMKGNLSSTVFSGGKLAIIYLSQSQVSANLKKDV